jgi:hypothetical protein
MKLDLDKILELEFIHDNKKDIEVIKNSDNCYNMIERKQIKIKTDILNPEEIMKEYIFKNINYNNLKIKTTPYENNIGIDDKIIFKEDIILIFDTMQLKLENIKLLKYIFKNKNIRIFIPFIYLAEQLLINVKPIKIQKKINYYKNETSFNCGDVLFDEYFNENNELLEYYKTEAENIGFYYDNIDDKLINYNIFSNKNKLFNDENKLNIEYKKEIIYQLNILYKYFKNFRFINRRKKFYKNIMKLKEEFELYFIENNKIKENMIFNIDTYKIFENIKTFIMSLKESRDSYYLFEIKKIMENELYRNTQFFYITSDEITNCRCILEQISSINIYGDIPRYIISINNTKIILKLFNIFQNLIKVSDTKSEIYKLIENVQKINSQQILSNTKALLIKEYSGGFYDEIVDKKIDLVKFKFNYNIFDKQYMPFEISSIMEQKLRFVKNRNYREIINYIYNLEKKILDLYANFSHKDDFQKIEQVIKRNPSYISAINEFNLIFEELVYLYDAIPPNELVMNLQAIDKRNFALEDDGEELTDLEIAEIDKMDTIPDIRNFTNLIEEVLKIDSNKFNNLLKKKIQIDNWNGLYCAWFLNIKINYHHKNDTLKFMKYIFPELFEKYPIEDYIMMFHIQLEYYIREEKQKCKENDFYDDMSHSYSP